MTLSFLNWEHQCVYNYGKWDGGLQFVYTAGPWGQLLNY